MRVKKAEAARQLGLSKARISQLVAKGMPVDAAGQVDLDQARRWIEVNVDVGRREGWHEARGLERGKLEVDAPAGPYAPALAFKAPGHRGYAISALTALYWAPLVTAAAVAEAGGTREMAEKAADIVTLGLWEGLDKAARDMGLPAQAVSGEVICLDQATALGWVARVNWPALFPAEVAKPASAPS